MIFWIPAPELWADAGPIPGHHLYRYRKIARRLWGKFYNYFPICQEWVDQWREYLHHLEESAESYQMWLDQQAEYLQTQGMYVQRGHEIAEQIPYELHTMGLSYRRRVQDRKDDRPYEKVDYCHIETWFFDDYAFYFWIATWYPYRPFGVTVDKFFPNQDASPISLTLTASLGALAKVEYNEPGPNAERPGLWIVIEHRTGRGNIPNKVSYQQCLLAMPKGAQPLAWPAGLGKNKQLYLADLAEIFNLGIGGSVGGGKSNEINVILCTFISRNRPEDLRLFLIDFKRVELAFYKGLPHLGGDIDYVRKKSIDPETGKEKLGRIRTVPVGYEPKENEALFPPYGQKVIMTGHELITLLDYALAEIERRTKLLEGKVKKISTWNKRFPHKKLSRWGIVIDELADVMLQPRFKAKIEERLVRVGQLGRALGIHLILATQTPKSVVITGLIQNNITNWIAFRCGNGIASGLMLDGKYDAARLPAVPGRCVWREGAIMTEIQTPEITDLTVRSIVKAAKRGEISHVVERQRAIAADKIFEYALHELDGYCPYRELYYAFKKQNVPRKDIEEILKEYQVAGSPGALEPEIEINDQVYYLSPPMGTRPRQLIPALQFEAEFEKKWAEILVPYALRTAENGKQGVRDISKIFEIDSAGEAGELIDERS